MAKTYQFVLELKDKVLGPMKKITKGFTDSAKKANKVNEAIAKINSTTSKLKAKVLGVNKAFGGLPATIAGVFAVGKVTEFGGAVVDTLAEFERFEAVLTNTLGSSSAAKKALDQITEFASNTPFQVNELSESFVKLANQNFTPTMAEMTKLGDLAAAVGVDFGRLTDAVLSGRTMEFDSLKTFGITAKKEGDKIAFNFKGQTKVVEASSQAVTDYVLSLGELKGVQGAMASITKTTGGQLSNLSDRYTQLKLQIGQGLKPVISASIDIMADMIERAKELVSWVRANSEMVKKWTKNILKVTAVILGLVAAVKTVSVIVSIVKGAVAVFTLLKNALLGAQVVMLGFNAVFLANPIGLVIAGVAALVAAIWGLIKLFPKIGVGLKGFYDGVVKYFKMAWEFVSNTFIAPMLRGLNKIKSLLGFGGKKELIQPVKPKTVEDMKAVAENFKAAGAGLSDVTGKVVGGLKGFGGEVVAAFKPKKTMLEETKPMAKKAIGKPKQSAVSKGLSQVVGASKSSKVINISIESLVEVLNVHAASKGERPGAIRREMEKVFLELSNNINHAS